VNIINNIPVGIIQPDLASYVSPSFKSEGFNGPSCGTFAHQVWSKAAAGYNVHDIVPDTAQCMKCKNYSIWHEVQMIYPPGGNAPQSYVDFQKISKKIMRKLVYCFNIAKKFCSIASSHYSKIDRYNPWKG
jgi:hypothetical protein